MTAVVATRRCVHCGADYDYPTGGGYRRCTQCRRKGACHTRPRRTGAYESRICKGCDRPYLFPFYGGHKLCNDCTMGESYE